ncbi:unnamed protein product [Adineta steineri]|uniref:Microbial-type PARG catalytic domain-containing protein n=1 Tax=Adineta steineri TaxID=433720 RepID=A0A819XX47_9BILA|nr:unnamed protein product [Adineta steineri]CAF4149846.1 unnamed protein product [Adineta steineri]
MSLSSSSSLLYIPCASLNSEDIESIIQLCLSEDSNRVDKHGGRKAAIKYLLNMHSVGFDLSPYIDLNKLKNFEEEFERLKKFDFFKKEFDDNQDETFEAYWELNLNSSKIHQIAKNTRQLTNTLSNGFSPEQLKIYFNPKQIDNIPFSKATLQSSGFVDNDSRDNFIKYPIDQRQNEGIINTKRGRIEQVIFHIPLGKQIIVLDFADERMPGGLFLRGATTQEETICYNSDLYRALLDLKYNRFDGGFMIPEFGCLHIKHVQFFKPPEHKESRKIDIIAAACYDLTREHGLYTPPEFDEQIEINTRKKLETIIASAQANTEGNGKDTYLLLGPIGCGAFQNKIEKIAKLWAEILYKPLNDQLNTQQRHAFQHIWFISGTDQKLKVFEQAFNIDSKQRL